jgi:single-strand DNA-binding protein
MRFVFQHLLSRCKRQPCSQIDPDRLFHIIGLNGSDGLGPSRRSRFIPSGAAVCSFRVATKRPAEQSESGERMFETDWTTVEAWEKLAERCAQPLQKGSRVRVIGSLHTRSWEDRQSGQKRFKTVVRAEDVLFLSTRAGAGRG